MSTISVVIPAYNEADTIGRCLDSLVNQSRRIDEIIVVDNASTDATPTIVDEFVEDNENVRRIAEFQPGVIPARNRGFDSATSDIIAKTDADTFVRPDWAERIVGFFDSEEGQAYDGLTGLVLTWDGPSPALQRRLVMSTLGKLADGGPIGGLSGPNYAIRQAAWKQVRDSLLSDPDIWEELDLSLAMTDSGSTMYFDPLVHVDTSCRQLRHSPWQNRSYIAGGVRTAVRRGDEAAAKALKVDRPARFLGFTVMWLLFRPWDHERRNWRPHRLLMPLERRRTLVTCERRSGSRGRRSSDDRQTDGS